MKGAGEGRQHELMNERVDRVPSDGKRERECAGSQYI